ncbi:decarboxylase DEC1 [Fusarium mexicanum]|uniref:Decarboxylase DEC1 n=1 Tax=Fusarium mexicanum TaxID=751941 RepID=A0A8H5N1N8_9HYPO|nr:decarboxylase DEC1 [Fusarium mexicanum]
MLTLFSYGMDPIGAYNVFVYQVEVKWEGKKLPFPIELDDMLARCTAVVTFTQPGKKIVDFSVHPLTAELDATLTIVESSAVVFSSPIAQWHYWILSQLRSPKNAARVREECMRCEIDKAVKGMSKDGSESGWATRSAHEFKLIREEASDKKAERPPSSVYL